MSLKQHRPRGEEGLSLVEMLIAIFVISIGLFALLSSFLTSSRSLQVQKGTSGATRVASTLLEDLRAGVAADPLNGYANLASGGPTVVSHNGIAYSVTHVVTEVDSDPANATTVDTVKAVDVTVEWDDPSGAHQRTYNSSIARRNYVTAGLGGPAIGDMTVSPSTATVDSTGATTSTVTVVVPITGATGVNTVSLTWTDDVSTHTVYETLPEGATQVEFVFAAGDIVKSVPEGDTDRISFQAAIDSVTKSVQLNVRQSSTGPGVSITHDITPAVIYVWGSQRKESDPCYPNDYTNVDAVTFTAYVDGLDTTTNTDTVFVRIPLEGGLNEEVVLVRDAVDLTKWTVTIQPCQLAIRGPKHKDATEHQDFTFTARRQSDGVEATGVRSHPVNRKSNK